jgi:hypothetical protein
VDPDELAPELLVKLRALIRHERWLLSELDTALDDEGIQDWWQRTSIVHAEIDALIPAQVNPL